MATITKTQGDRTPTFTAAYGNATVLHYSLETNANGSAKQANSNAAIAAGDKVRLGILQGGLKLIDSLAIVSVVLAGAAKLGFEYVDGVDDAKVPQDDDYFNAALAMAAQGRVRANNNAVAPVVLPKDAYLILTPAAAQTAAGKLDVFVDAVWIGDPSI